VSCIVGRNLKFAHVLGAEDQVSTGSGPTVSITQHPYLPIFKANSRLYTAPVTMGGITINVCFYSDNELRPLEILSKNPKEYDWDEWAVVFVAPYNPTRMVRREESRKV